MHTTLVPEPIRLTYEDFCALPEDGRRYEILDGDLYISPSPDIPHQRIARRLVKILLDHVERFALGEVFLPPCDVVLDEHSIVEPDLIFVSTARASIVKEKNIQGAPDLLVEILSPSTSKRDLRDKRNLYARCGVDWYWVIDPKARTVLELQLVGRAYATVAELSGEAVWRPGLFGDLSIKLAALIEP